MQECECEKWECHDECKPLTDSEIDAILSFRAAFDLSVEEKQTLAKCNFGCPYGNYTKCREFRFSPVVLKGHPIVCHTGDSCSSALRILRAASTHFPILKKLLPHVTSALSCHNIVLILTMHCTVVTTTI